MFFLIGGIQPRTTTVDDTPRLCSHCGLAQARLKRIDHYLSLFFIPLFPVKRGEPVVICDRCGAVSPPEHPMGRHPLAGGSGRDRCARCGAPVEADFRYCPHCGAPT